ncbi:MAG: anti-sigma F factor [Fusicatenibacter sp.]|nr:anti-sigma F factor [Lachnospiraceae bacterium]MDY2937218.1 anti-sigma F factor [Fusicatenibacter sp.]
MEQRLEPNADRKNKMSLEFESRACNESFARVAVAAFLTQLNPTMEEVADVKTAVSEAITNAIIHGYDNTVQMIRISCELEGRVIRVSVIDSGKGIEDVEKAMEPMYTTRPDLERSGMGFSFMEAFMDRLEVESKPGCGTTVRMEKIIGRTSAPESE